MSLDNAPNPPAKERADSRRKRLRLLEATREAMAEHGLNISGADIAARAEVGIGTLYRRFGSKEALIEAVLTDAVSAVVDAAARALAEQDAAVGLETFMADLCRSVVANRGLKEVAAESRVRRSESYRAQIALVRDALKTLTERAQQAGAVRQDVTWRDVAILAQASATTGGALGVESGEEQWQRNLAVLMDGLRTSGSHAVPGHPPIDSHT
jgi:AcrR family transcriptional regulator